VLATFAIRDYSEGTDGGFAHAQSPFYRYASTASGKRMVMEDDYATKAELAATKVELIERMEGNKLDLLERLEKVETTLLKEFRKWARSFEPRAC
jgi:hypothetical protein